MIDSTSGDAGSVIGDFAIDDVYIAGVAGDAATVIGREVVSDSRVTDGEAIAVGPDPCAVDRISASDRHAFNG